MRTRQKRRVDLCTRRLVMTDRPPGHRALAYCVVLYFIPRPSIDAVTEPPRRRTNALPSVRRRGRPDNPTRCLKPRRVLRCGGRPAHSSSHCLKKPSVCSPQAESREARARKIPSSREFAVRVFPKSAVSWPAFELVRRSRRFWGLQSADLFGGRSWSELRRGCCRQALDPVRFRRKVGVLAFLLEQRFTWPSVQPLLLVVARSENYYINLTGPLEEPLKVLSANSIFDLIFFNLFEEAKRRRLLNRTMHGKTRIHADQALLDFDQFDCLPDSLVLLILNKLDDVRSLGRCSAVSKRFNVLVPLVHDVCVKIDRVVAVDGDLDDALNLASPKPRSIISHFLKLMLFAVTKPFHDMRNPNGAGRPLLPHHSPVQVLRNFSHVRNLRVELPRGDVGVEEGVLLKWRADYGSSLQNCVILGGTLVDRKPVGIEHELSSDDNGCMPESFYTNGGLKLRVVWTISCLIAASTRHYLLRSIIKDHPTLRSLVLADADGQGTLCMGTEQLKEFRENQLSASACFNRTQVPACNMKLKYAPYIELPGGSALQGATLLVIKPSEHGSHGSRKEAEAFVSGAFDAPLRSAVKTLMGRRTYLLEMNSF